jgi:gas vesicle protein
MKNNDLIKGALVGCCLGGLCALLLAPKAGKELQDDIVDSYNNLNDQTHEYIDEFKEYASTIMDYLNGVEHNTHSPNHLMMGGLAGVVLGAIAGLLLAPQAGQKLRQQLGSKYDKIRENAEEVMDDIKEGKHKFEEKLEDWKETFVTILDKFNHPKKKHVNSSHGAHGTQIDNILDWASLGLRVYNTLQKGR